jgi:hypothetical protein
VAIAYNRYTQKYYLKLAKNYGVTYMRQRKFKIKSPSEKQI